MEKYSLDKTADSLNDDDVTALQNGLQEVFGLGGGNPFTQEVGFSQTIENVDTLFQNLRWYFVSNMRQVLSQAYVELGLIQTIVDVPVEDAFRGGVKLHSKQLDEDQIKQLQVSLDRDDDLGQMAQGCKWQRLFGGGGVLIMTDQDPSTPFDIDAVNEDTPLEFRAVDLWELFWDKQNTDGYDPQLQIEDYEFYSYYGIKLHKSRVMKLKGRTAPSFLRPRLRGWGFSEVEALIRSMNQYLKATDLGFEVLDEFKVDVYRVKNLTNTLLKPGGEQTVRRRFHTANQIKNYQSALVMDSEDEYAQKQLSFAGLGEAMTGIKSQVAADLRFPQTKLFGESSPGFNSGEDAIENYNSMIESSIRGKIKYDILRICEIKCQKLFGFVPDDMEIEFSPLRMLSATDEETVKTSKFNRVLSAKSAGEITTFEFREAVNKGNLLDIKLDNAGDPLNPLDADVADLIAGTPDPLDPNTDVDDPGANRTDTKKPRAWDANKKKINAIKNITKLIKKGIK